MWKYTLQLPLYIDLCFIDILVWVGLLEYFRVRGSEKRLAR